MNQSEQVPVATESLAQAKVQQTEQEVIGGWHGYSNRLRVIILPVLLWIYL
jgi:hypothetical protein